MDPTTIDLGALTPLEAAVLDVQTLDGQPSGWKITFAGPAHAKTVAYSERQSRRDLHKQALIEQARVNGKKYKAEERTPADVRRDNVEWIVARIVDWTPVSLGGAPIAFSETAAMELLVRPELGFVYAQCIEFLNEDKSFMKRSATASAPSPGAVSS